MPFSVFLSSILPLFFFRALICMTVKFPEYLPPPSASAPYFPHGLLQIEALLSVFHARSMTAWLFLAVKSQPQSQDPYI